MVRVRRVPCRNCNILPVMWLDSKALTVILGIPLCMGGFAVLLGFVPAIMCGVGFMGPIYLHDTGYNSHSWSVATYWNVMRAFYMQVPGLFIAIFGGNAVGAIGWVLDICDMAMDLYLEHPDFLQYGE
jgi:hypothetical protein